MRKVSEILAVLDKLAPAYMKEEWDNVGLLCGHMDAPVERVLVALDPTMAVLQEALKRQCGMVLTHHPVLHGSVRSVNDTDPTGSVLLFAAENHIACVNMHTNLDCVPGGVNDVLAAKLSLADVTVASPRGEDEQGRPYGYLHTGKTEICDLREFAEFVKKQLSCDGLRYADGGKKVSEVAVGGGNCSSMISEVLAAGCDTFVTADMKYHDFAKAAEIGLNLIDAGHYQTENPICTLLAETLRSNFSDLEVLYSESLRDRICFL